MNRQIFEGLSLEEQLIFVNERKQMTTKQIADEIGMPSSSLSKLFTSNGYRRVKRQYVKKEQVSQNSHSDLTPLEELLQYKNQIIDIVLQKQRQESMMLDFSVLDQLRKDKETISFDCSKELSDKLNAVLSKRGYKKQALLSLLLYNYLQSQQ